MSIATIPIKGPLLRGRRRPRVALVGRPKTGKSTIFQAASSPATHHEKLAGIGGAYEECMVDVGLDQISLVDLPSIESLHHLREHDRVVLMYLLWGDHWPAVARHESEQPASAFRAPDVLIQVVDATTMERDLELTMELSMLGRPMVIALNRIDEARDKGIFINIKTLSAKLGVPVVPTVAHMGKGISQLFDAAVQAARDLVCPLPQALSPHLEKALRPLQVVLSRPEVSDAFCMPMPLLVSQVAENQDYFSQELQCHFPDLLPEIAAARRSAEANLPRSLEDELHADRHHRAALLIESASNASAYDESAVWQRWLDEIFLHPQWGLVGSVVVFAAVLFCTFEVSALLDSLTSARLVELSAQWEPASTLGVIGRAVIDGLIGLVGIVVPYMIPLVLLLVALEESGIMHRVAFVVDRGFHQIGLHGGIAVPFLISLGCNVPAISAAAAATTGKDRLVASLLITFVPCSARSAIILALGGKYLGAFGVTAIFVITLVVIGLLGKWLSKHYSASAPGLIQEIPPYALPTLNALLRKTWERTSDIVTIVTPLLVIGSVILALLNHWGADAVINTLLTPVTHWWLGLPVVLGVPILFGVLRKELSLLMIYQALGTQDIAPLLNWVQIATFLIFLTFYVPCVSTFAVMMRVLSRREAIYSVLLSVAVALFAAAATRLVLTVINWLA